MSRRPQLLLFTRAPEPGRVKTRLQPVLGERGAAALHAALTKHCLRQLCGVADIALWTTGDGDAPQLSDWAGYCRGGVHRQCGDGLGERLAHALAQTLRTVRPVMVIGADCPGLDADYVRAAWQQLQSADAVVGPARDGGFVLLGLHAVELACFAGINWGSASVCSELQHNLHALGWRCRRLPSLADIDIPADLVRLADFPELSNSVRGGHCAQG